MGEHCTVYILNIIMMISQEKDKDEVREYKGKEGLEQRVTYVIKIMFMNYRVKKIVKTKFIQITRSFFYRYDLHDYLNRSWRLFF